MQILQQILSFYSRSSQTGRLYLLLFVLFLLMGQSSCSSANPKVALSYDVPEAFSEPDSNSFPGSDSVVSSSLVSSSSDTVEARWWQSFEDPQLNVLIDSALQGNPDILTTWYRLQRAWAVRQRDRAGFFPSLNAFAEAETRAETFSASPQNLYELGLSAEYEIDLWGKVRASSAAADFRVREAQDAWRAAALSLTGQVAKTWYDLAEQMVRNDLLREQKKVNAQTLQLLQSRFEAGLIRPADILRQEQLLEASEEQLLVSNTRVQELKNKLAVLLGKSPTMKQNVAIEALPIPPPVPATGLPSELIQRRPDVRMAYHRLMAADRDLAVAVSNRFPRISITASVSSSAQDPAELFDNWGYALGGNLLAPIFAGGRLKAESDIAAAQKQQELYQYAKKILTAFQEVENALIANQMQEQRIRSIEAQLTLAEESVRRLSNEYMSGMVSYLDVLTARVQEQNLRLKLSAAQLQMIHHRIDLFLALAGGFDVPQDVQSLRGNDGT